MAEGKPRQRSIRCPSAQEGMPRWLGAPCFENSDTVLPWGFDTSTFRVAQWCNGSTPGLHLGECRIETDLRHQAAIG